MSESTNDDISADIKKEPQETLDPETKVSVDIKKEPQETLDPETKGSVDIIKEPQESLDPDKKGEPVPVKLIRNQATKSIEAKSHKQKGTRLISYDEFLKQDAATGKVVEIEKDGSFNISGTKCSDKPDLSSKSEGSGSDNMSSVKGVCGSEEDSCLKKLAKVTGIPVAGQLLAKARSSMEISPTKQIGIMNLCQKKSDISKMIASGQKQVIVLKSSKPLDQATLVKASLQAIQKSNNSPPVKSTEVSMKPLISIKNTPVYNVLKDGQQAIKLTDSVSELGQKGGVKPSFLFEDKHGKLTQPPLSKLITVKIPKPSVHLQHEEDILDERRKSSPHKKVDAEQPFTPFMVDENELFKKNRPSTRSSASIVAKHSVLSAALKKPPSSKIGSNDRMKRKGPVIMSHSLSDIEPNGKSKHLSRQEDFQLHAKPTYDEEIHAHLRMKEQIHSATKAKLKEQIQSSAKAKLNNIQTSATKEVSETKSSLRSGRSLLHPPLKISSTKPTDCTVQKETLQIKDTIDSNSNEKAKHPDCFGSLDTTLQKDSKNKESFTKTKTVPHSEEDTAKLTRVSDDNLESLAKKSSDKSEAKQTAAIPSKTSTAAILSKTSTAAIPSKISKKTVKKQGVLENLKYDLLKFCTAHIEEQEKLNSKDLRKEQLTSKLRARHEEDVLDSSSRSSDSNKTRKENQGSDPHCPDEEAGSTKRLHHGVEEYISGLSSYIRKFISKNRAVREVDETDIERTVILTTKIKKRSQIYTSIMEPDMIRKECLCSVTKNVVPDEQTYYMDGFLKYLPNVGILLCGEYEITGLKLNDDWYLCIPEIINRMPENLSTNLHMYIQLDNAITKPMPDTFRWYMRKRQGIPVTTGNLMLSLKSFQMFLSQGIKHVEDTNKFESNLFQSGTVYKRLLGHNLRCLSCEGLICTGESTKYFTDIDVDDIVQVPSQISIDDKIGTEQDIDSEEKLDENECERVQNDDATDSRTAHPVVAMKIGMVDVNGELFHSFKVHQKIFLSLNQLYVRNVIVVDTVLTCLAKMKISPRRPPSKVEKFLQDIHSSFINTAWISMATLQYVCLQGFMKILNWRKDIFDAICDGHYKENFINTIYAEDDTEYDTLYLNAMSGRIIRMYQGSVVVPGTPQVPKFPAQTRQLLRDVEIGVHHGVVKLADDSLAEKLINESRLKKRKAEERNSTSSKKQHMFKPLSEVVPLRYTYKKKKMEKNVPGKQRKIAVTNRTYFNKNNKEEESFAKRKGRKRKCTQKRKCYIDEEEYDDNQLNELNDITKDNEKGDSMIVNSTPSEKTTVEFIIETECVGENKVLFGMQSAGNDSYNGDHADYGITKKHKKQVSAGKNSQNNSTRRSSEIEESKKEDEEIVSYVEPSESTSTRYTQTRVKTEPFDPSWENIDSENVAGVISDGKGSLYVVHQQDSGDESFEEKFDESLKSENNGEQDRKVSETESNRSYVALDNIKVEADDYFL